MHMPYSASQFTSPVKTVLLAECAGNTGVNVSSNVVSSWAPDGGSPSGYGASPSYDPNGGNASSVACSVDSSRLRYAAGMFGERALSGGSCYSSMGRHTNGSNFLLADGHVKYLLGSQVSTGINPSSSQSTQTNYAAPSTNSAAGTSGTFQSGAIPAATFSVL